MFKLIVLAVLASILWTVFLSLFIEKHEQVKKLKGYRVWVPLLLTIFFVWLFWAGAFIATEHAVLCWLVVFIFSLAILFVFEKRIKYFKEYKKRH